MFLFVCPFLVWEADTGEIKSVITGYETDENIIVSDTLPNIQPYGSYLVLATPVPVPAAVWLFGSGLIGLIGVARRKSV